MSRLSVYGRYAVKLPISNLLFAQRWLMGPQAISLLLIIIYLILSSE